MRFIKTTDQGMQIGETLELCSTGLQNAGNIKANPVRLQLYGLLIKNYNCRVHNRVGDQRVQTKYKITYKKIYCTTQGI